MSYEEDQAKLKRELEGAPEDPDDASFIPPEPEVNPEVYKDVEPLLFRGFLYQAAEINGVPFVFKSLNQHEFDALNLGGVPSGNHKLVQRYYDRFLSYGVFKIDDQNVLVDREESLPELVDFFKSLSGEAKQKVVRYLSELNRRASRAVLLSEVFAMESTSRHRWSQYQGMDLTSPAVTGIRGTEYLGLNWGQLAWRAFNYFEDMKVQMEVDWENTKFVASSMAGKGMNKIHSQDKTRRKSEMMERRERKDKILRLAVLGEPFEDSKKDSAQLKVARTVEELTDQLERDLKGEKDWHDMVIADHERRLKEEYEAKSQRLKDLAAAHLAEYGESRLAGSTDRQGLSKAQVEERVQRRRQLMAQRLAQGIVYPELQDPKMANHIEKWQSAVPLIRTSRDPSTATPAVTRSRPVSQPFNLKR
jgi:hypothetical protein